MGFNLPKVKRGSHKFKAKKSRARNIPSIHFDYDDDDSNSDDEDVRITGISEGTMLYLPFYLRLIIYLLITQYIIDKIILFYIVCLEYLDHGDPTYKCPMCGAFMWYDETLRGGTHGKRIGFSLCCLHGKVSLPTISKQAPKMFVDLLTKRHPQSMNFIENIRAYNMMFSFTSMGGKVDSKVNQGNGPYCFRISGQNFHRLGSLVPTDGETPKFSQLYIYDTSNEIENRMSAVR